MSKRPHSRRTAIDAPSRTLTSAQSQIAQRKCACGAPAGMTGECEQCGSKQLTVQRPIDQPGIQAGQPVANVLNFVPDIRRPIQSRSGHDFSRIQVLGPGQRSSGGPGKPKKGTPGKAKKPAGTTSIGAPVRQTYEVTGSTLADAATDIEAREEAGLTEWNPKLDYKTDDQETVTSATVTVTLTVTMPKWAGAAKLSKKAKAEWDRFYKALETHEQGHVDLVHKKLSGIGASLVGKSEADANAAFQEAVQSLQEANDAYDVDTDHGRKKGTILDTTIK